jgi:hypothetical protein
VRGPFRPARVAKAQACPKDQRPALPARPPYIVRQPQPLKGGQKFLGYRETGTSRHAPGPAKLCTDQNSRGRCISRLAYLSLSKVCETKRRARTFFFLSVLSFSSLN